MNVKRAYMNYRCRKECTLIFNLRELKSATTLDEVNAAIDGRDQNKLLKNLSEMSQKYGNSQ